MVVARAREPDGAVRRLLVGRRIATRRRDAADGFERRSDVGARKREIAMTSGPPTYKETLLYEASQVRRRRRRRDTRAASQFPGGKRLATQQRAEHRGSGRVADHAGNAGELSVRSGSCTHASYGNRQTVRYSPNR